MMFPSGSLNRSSKGANGQEFCLCEDIASTRSVNGMLVWTGPLRYESPASGSALTGGTLLSLSHSLSQSHPHYMRAILLPVGARGPVRLICSRGRMRNASTARWSVEPAVVMAVMFARVQRRLALVNSYVPRRRASESLSYLRKPMRPPISDSCRKTATTWVVDGYTHAINRTSFSS